MVPTRSRAKPLRVVAIADNQHMYEGHGTPLDTIGLPLLGGDGEVAFDSVPGFGTPIMEKGGKLLTVDTEGGNVLARFGDHLVYRVFAGMDILRARDGKDGANYTILTQGDVVESATVGVFSIGDFSSHVRTNVRGDVILADYSGNVFGIPYKGAKNGFAG